MIEPKGTCTSCGYEKKHCICNSKSQFGTIHRRNTSGQRRMYNNYVDYRDVDDYAMTSRINRTSADTRKVMQELNPVDGETVNNFLKRTDIAETNVIDYSIKHHLFGTAKTWACHTTSRYCFICTMAQFLNVTRAIWLSSVEVLPEFGELIIRVTPSEDPDQPPELHLES